MNMKFIYNTLMLPLGSLWNSDLSHVPTISQIITFVHKIT